MLSIYPEGKGADEMKVNRIPLVTCFLVAGLVAAGCSASSQEDSGGSGSGIIRYGSYEPTSLDPRKSGVIDTIFLEPIYDSLITRTPAGEFEPGLATEWELTGGGRVFSLTLREGVEFQDGTPFDAEAVKANILAGQAPGTTRATELKPIESIEVVDPTHVQLNLSGPGSHLVGVFAGEAGMMISPAALEKGNVEQEPVGAGPYKVVERSPSRISYRVWDGYWAKDSVKNKGLEFIVNPDATTQFRALQSGQIDAQAVLAAQLQEAKETDGLEVLAEPTTSLWQVMLNVSHPVLADPQVRKALMHALDREAISNNVFAGSCVASLQPYGKGFAGHVSALADTAAAFDLAESKRLLSEAGVRAGTELRLAVSTSTQQQELGAILQAALAKIGITIKLQVLDQAHLSIVRRKGDFDMALSLAPTARPDPTQYIADFYVKGGANNQGGFSLKGIDGLLREARGTSEEARRDKILQQVTSKVYEAGPPTIPMCASTLNFAFRDNVSGLQVPAANDYDWASVSIE